MVDEEFRIAQMMADLEKTEITTKKDANALIMMDINELMNTPSELTTKVPLFNFHVESLNALHTRIFEDWSGNNKYFDFDYNSTPDKNHISVKGKITNVRTFRDIATILKSTLAASFTGEGDQMILPLNYAQTQEDAALNKLLGDINHNFEYIKPRLNMINLSSILASSKSALLSPTSLFSSAKRKAIQSTLKKFDTLHHAETKQGNTMKLYKEELSKKEEAITKARTDAKKANKSNFKGAMSLLHKAKDAYSSVVDEYIAEAEYADKAQLRKEKDRVLSDKDLTLRAQRFFDRSGGRRTRRLRQRQ